MTQLGSPATESGSGSGDSGGRPATHGSRLARRRRVLLGAGLAAALLAIGGLIGAYPALRAARTSPLATLRPA